MSLRNCERPLCVARGASPSRETPNHGCPPHFPLRVPASRVHAAIRAIYSLLEEAWDANNLTSKEKLDLAASFAVWFDFQMENAWKMGFCSRRLSE
jgi:hypothetical protein